MELQSLSQSLRKQQKAHLQKMKQNQTGSFLKSNGMGSSADPLEFLDRLESGRGGEGGMSEAQLQGLVAMEEQAGDRDRQVTNIVASIEELSQVMKDLSILIVDQGTVLDRIDYNMQATGDSVKAGVLELERAEKHQKSSRNWLIIGFLSIACFIMLLLLLAKSL